MAEHYTCKECEELYDDSDGSIEDQLCQLCIDQLSKEAWNVLEELESLITITSKS